MKFFDFCTDVTAVGTTAVLALFVAGSVASQDDASDGPASARADSAFSDSAFSDGFAPLAGHESAVRPLPDVRAENAAGTQGSATVRAPRPVDLQELERSLDALLAGETPRPAFRSAVVGPTPAEDAEASARTLLDFSPGETLPEIADAEDPFPESPLPGEFKISPTEPFAVAGPRDAFGSSLFAESETLSVDPVRTERPDTRRPAPPTRPLTAQNLPATDDFMDGLLEDAEGFGAAAFDAPAARTGPVEILTLPDF